MANIFKKMINTKKATTAAKIGGNTAEQVTAAATTAVVTLLGVDLAARAISAGVKAGTIAGKGVKNTFTIRKIKNLAEESFDCFCHVKAAQDQKDAAPYINRLRDISVEVNALAAPFQGLKPQVTINVTNVTNDLVKAESIFCMLPEEVAPAPEAAQQTEQQTQQTEQQ